MFKVKWTQFFGHVANAPVDVVKIDMGSPYEDDACISIVLMWIPGLTGIYCLWEFHHCSVAISSSLAILHPLTVN